MSKCIYVPGRFKKSKMAQGIRVVRGPDWDLGDNDGGEDHVGTITEVKGDDAVVVQWDMGNSTTCRTGKDGKHDIRVFDYAPVGVQHSTVACVGCEEICIMGTRWMCSMCDNVNLCTPCYFDDEHNTQHSFKRLDLPGSTPVAVAKRSTSGRARSLGIYPGATVKRGPHWEGNEDGGPGHNGTVEDVVNYGKNASSRNAVRVLWRNKQRKVCRVGYDGKVDLTCVEEAPGADYYKEHLGTLDLGTIRKWSSHSEVIKVGDDVCVDVSKEELKEMQRGHGGWTMRMEEIIGCRGQLSSVTTDGNALVDVDGEKFQIAFGALRKIPVFNVNDTVRILNDKEKVKRLQEKHGGWDDSMEKTLGKVGKVSVIDSEGDVAVAFGQQAWVFHPACLVPAPGESPFVLGEPPPQVNRQQSQARDPGAAILHLMANLLILEALSARDNLTEILVGAIINNDINTVRQLLGKESTLKDKKCKTLAPLHYASHKGHVDIVAVLLDAGADIDVLDDNGNTPLFVGLMAGSEEVGLLLVERGANIGMCNKFGRSPLHMAAIKNLPKAVKILLAKGCDVNIQDVEGDTPLHDAIAERNDDIAMQFIAHPDLDVWKTNKKKMNSLHFAAFKGHSLALDKLLSREPKLVDCPSAEDFRALHITAVNNHINEANILIIKGKANTEAQNTLGYTPLHVANLEAYFDMVQLLLTHGAKWETVDKKGNTPLHLCMMGRRTESRVLQMFGLTSLAEDNERIKIANFLYQHGARVDVQNNEGKTPISGCPFQRMRDAVQTYVDNNKPTPADRKQTRPSTAKVAQEMFSQSALPCTKCEQAMSCVRFLPCKHKVTCERCCQKFRVCPVCNKEIHMRVSLDNKPVADGCGIQ